ncbi:MAG TPA: DUF4339 domain-containing protein [Pirellulales bacterium]|nr:DUF4339 domain-containing protein [Pirellulales bacterium]
MADWFYKVMGEEYGPISSAELKEKAADGTIDQSSLIRKGRDGDWISAHKTSLSFGGPVVAIDTSKARMPRVKPAAPVETAKPAKRSTVTKFWWAIPAALALIAIPVIVFFAIAEKPEVAFKRLIKPKVDKIQEQTIKAGSVQYRVGAMSYDIKKTDSLVSPYLAVLRFILGMTNSNNPDDHFRNSGGHMEVNYAFQDGSWKLVNATHHQYQGDRKEELRKYGVRERELADIPDFLDWPCTDVAQDLGLGLP